MKGECESSTFDYTLGAHAQRGFYGTIYASVGGWELDGRWSSWSEWTVTSFLFCCHNKFPLMVKTLYYCCSHCSQSVSIFSSSSFSKCLGTHGATSSPLQPQLLGSWNLHACTGEIKGFTCDMPCRFTWRCTGIVALLGTPLGLVPSFQQRSSSGVTLLA